MRINGKKYLRLVRLMFGVALGGILAACGSGSGSDANSGIGTTVTVESIGTVDISGQIGLSAKNVTLDRSIRADINTLAVDEGLILDFQPTDETTISIILTQMPNAAGVPVALKVNGTVPILADRSYAVYVYSPADAEDGAESLSTLESNYDEDSGSVAAVLPDWTFVQVGNQYIARVKIGLVKTYDPTAVAGVRTSASADHMVPLALSVLPKAQQLECPLAECIETSQFNPFRQLNGVVRKHKGNDFRAAAGTNLYVGAGATLLRGWTPAKFSALGSPKGQGVSLFFDYGASLLRVAYFHLSNIDSIFVDSVDAKKIATVTTTVRTLVGQTGTTGTAAPAPHLHMEVFLPVGKVCRSKGKNSAKTTVCSVSYAQTNPMNYLINSFAIDQPSILPVGSPTNFLVKALDKSGTVIRSEVGHAVEELSGDPTRKICFRDSAKLIDWQTSGNKWIDATQVPNLFCTEWQSKIMATKRAAGTTKVEVRYSTAVTTTVYDTIDSPVDSRSYGAEGFTKISASGQDLPADAIIWSCVRHNATGLLWEAHVTRRTPAHPCAWNANLTCAAYTNYGDGRAFDASTVPATVGSLCGKSGWRLPTEAEGRALVGDAAYVAGHIPYGAFQATWFGTDDTAYGGWTSSPVAGPSDSAWYVRFYFGSVDVSSRNYDGGFYYNDDYYNGSVRLVAVP